MGEVTITDLTKILEFLKNPGYLKKGKYWIAAKLGVSVEQVKEAKKLLNQYPVAETISSTKAELTQDLERSSRSVNNIKGEITSVVVLDFEPKDDEEIARLHKIDLTKYSIDSYYSKRAFAGKFAHTVLARKRKVDEVTVKSVMNDYVFEPKLIEKKDILINEDFVEGKLCVFNVTDFHLDKMDVKRRSTEERIQELYSVVDSLLFDAYRYCKIDELVYFVGSDFFNTDNYQGGTTKGTPQDNSMPWDEAFKVGLDVNITILTKLRQFTNKLKVVLVCGNHDYQKSFYMAQALQMYFRADSGVEFDVSADYRKAVTYGKVFIGANHGDCKVMDLPLIFAKEFPMLWGNATCHVIKTGDKHHYSVAEIQGVRVKKYPSLSGTDRWHDRNNYINSIRSVIVNIYDKNSQVAEFERSV